MVATRVGGNGELIAAGVSGALADAGDPVALAGAIAPYLKDEALRRAHGRAGRERVEQAFSMDAMVNKYTQVYDTILGSPRSGD